jgi:acetylornithine deacetylase/succinyl-diaminopimelate desuccinylase-like protein
MDTAFADREQPRLLQELVDFLSIPSVSTLPAHADDCRRAAEWLRAELTRLGCPVVNLIEGDGHPVVWAEGPTVPGRPTLLIYGHYDVQPPDPIEEWDTPPFAPSVRDGRLYARGAADDKGQVFCLLKAYEAVLDPDGRPPLNVRFIFEGEEECGGHVVFDLLRAEPERTRADAVLVCDMAYYAPEWPAVYTGLRGLCYAEIAVRTLQRDLHSGAYGGVAPNAIETLVRILAGLKDEDGEIRIPKR